MEFKTNGKKAEIGISLLGAISAFSVWSACNPSLFTVAQFTTEQSKKNARFGMKVGVALNAILAAGLYLAYGRKGLFPAILTGATGVGLYVLYERMLNKINTSNPTGQDMNEQAEGFKSKDQPNGPRTGLGGQNVGKGPGGSIHGGPWPGIITTGPGTPPPLQSSIGSEYEYPGSDIGHNAIQHANQPVWEHTYGQSV